MGSKTGLLLSLPLSKLILGSKGGQKRRKIRFLPIDWKHIRPTYTLIKYFIFLKKPVGSSFIILSCMNLQNTESRTSLQVLDPLLQHITASLRKSKLQKQLESY